MTRPIQLSTELNPAKFYAIVDLIQSINLKSKDQIEASIEDLDEAIEEFYEDAQDLMKVNNSMLAEVRRSTRRKEALIGVGEQDDPFEEVRNSLTGDNFLRVLFDVVHEIYLALGGVKSVAQSLLPGELILFGSNSNRHKGNKRFEFSTSDDYQSMAFEIQLNSGTIQKFVNGLIAAEELENLTISTVQKITKCFEGYYRMLVRRHSVDGMQIHKDPITTDLAITIFDNIDSSGEISEDGRKPDEVSAYTLRKAQIVAEAVKSERINTFIQSPSELFKYIALSLELVWKSASHLSKIFRPIMDQALDRLDLRKSAGRRPKNLENQVARFMQELEGLKDLDPQNITFKEKTTLLTAEERYALNFRNDTIGTIAGLLTIDTATSTDSLVKYVLGRKAELRAFYQDENSFYVCKIGSGNPFSGDAPGSLTISPGARPVVDMDEIKGSGFDEVKRFIGQVEASSKWHDLFVATSPSRTADKSNVLLIGPQGCGKSEVLRAVGGDKKSIGVFAQGSDFLTCWKGEAEKNPKRLFEGALKLHRDSRKHVHILIDEIDTVMNNDSGREAFGGTNLTTEFQLLMDGVVHYPHLSVWGATNHPERIPMPMIRRFSKVLIVGELSQDDRIGLLQHFSRFMPVADFEKGGWADLAKKLDGATGDVIRKIVDYVWREKMTGFVHNHPNKAEEILNFLNDKEKFQIASFDSKRRSEMHNRLRNFVELKAEDLEKSIELHLENIAIRHEIMTAQETYARAKAFLSSVRKEAVGDTGNGQDVNIAAKSGLPQVVETLANTE